MGGKEITINYIESPKVSIGNDYKGNYYVEFIDSDNDQIIHSSNIKGGMWTSCKREWFTNWVIKVNGEIVDKFNLNNKRVYIRLGSKALGDTIAWTPYIVKFAKKHNCKVILTTFHNEWFKGIEEYKDIEFVNHGGAKNYYVEYEIGWFKNLDDDNWDRKDMNPTPVNLIPLQQTATDVLGLEFEGDLNYGVNLGKGKIPIYGKYVVFGPQATSGCKEWDLDKWEELSVKFIEEGYKVVICSLHAYDIPNTIRCNGELDVTATHLKHAEAFIGLGSGLSWLNWSLDKHTYMINGFAKEGHEFTNNLTKITNDLCIKCWNDPVHTFDPGDWNWCPVYKGSELQHICQKSITVDQVFNIVINDLKKKENTEDKVVIECSDSLGDTIATIPYADKYRVDNNCKVAIKVNPLYKFLFEHSYPNLDYVDTTRGFDKIYNPHYQFYKKLQEGIAEHLGYKKGEWIRPLLNVKMKERPLKNKYVVINIHSTTQMKYWNHPDGEKVRGDSPYWNELCRMFRKNNLTPVVIERDELFGVAPNYNGLPKKSVKRVGMPLEDVVNYIQHAEFFIGLSSGLAWIAHGLGKKTAIIANFTNKDHEIPLDEYNYKRIVKKDVCHGCWNNPKYDLQNIFDNNKSMWDECPEHRGTNRQFECHTSITPEQVFSEIKEWI